MSACTHPSSMASTVVAFKQTVDERTAAALDQRVRVPQLQQPVPEIAAGESTWIAANVLERNACGQGENKRPGLKINHCNVQFAQKKKK